MFSYSKRTLLIRHQKTIFKKTILWTDITQLKEDDLDLLVSHLDSSIEVEEIIYGRIEYMIMKYNMQKSLHLKNDYYKLVSNSKNFPIMFDQFTHLFSDHVWELENVNPFMDVYRIELFNETKEEVKKIISHVKKKLDY